MKKNKIKRFFSYLKCGKRLRDIRIATTIRKNRQLLVDYIEMMSKVDGRIALMDIFPAGNILAFVNADVYDEDPSLRDAIDQFSHLCTRLNYSFHMGWTARRDHSSEYTKFQLYSPAKASYYLVINEEYPLNKLTCGYTKVFDPERYRKSQLDYLVKYVEL